MIDVLAAAGEVASNGDLAGLVPVMLQWGPAITAVFVIGWLFTSGRIIGKTQADQLRDTADKNHQAMIEAIKVSLTAVGQVDNLSEAATSITKTMAVLQERLDADDRARYTRDHRDDR